MTIDLSYSTVATAIGEVAIWWSGIETTTYDLAIRLSMLGDRQMYNRQSLKVLRLMLANMGQRELFATVKALAFNASQNHIFPKLEPLINELDNQIRAERNRIIHDSWYATGETASRTSRGAKIINAGPRNRVLRIQHVVKYASFDELEAVLKRMKAVYSELDAIRLEIGTLLAEKKEPLPAQP